MKRTSVLSISLAAGTVSVCLSAGIATSAADPARPGKATLPAICDKTFNPLYGKAGHIALMR